MNFKKIVMTFLFIIPFYTFSQNIYFSYTDSFAKLQSELRKEIGVKSLNTVELTSNTLNTRPYSLQIIGNSNYNSFIKTENLYSNIRILYIDNIDFSKVSVIPFDRLKKLEAIRFKNCKNINFENLDTNLSKSKSIKQIHFNKIKFGDWTFSFNKTTNLEVITFYDCYIKYFSEIELNLEEFTINKSRNVIDLKGLKIKRVTKVSIIESIIKEFPFSLSKNQNLEYLSLNGTKIKRKICENISGFESLLYLDITNSKINFNSKRFLDTKKVLIIDGSVVNDNPRSR